MLIAFNLGIEIDFGAVDIRWPRNVPKIPLAKIFRLVPLWIANFFPDSVNFASNLVAIMYGKELTILSENPF